MDYSVVRPEWEPFESVVHPEWEAFESIEPPRISWKRAKRAVATTTNLDGLLTISDWQARSRWIYGWHHNERRIHRLCFTKPHGFDLDGDPWYTAALYPAPPDPVYELNNLVGLVTWVGHVGCLWPGRDSELMLPLVKAAGHQSQHFIVPVFFGQDPKGPDRPTVLLPQAEELQPLLDRLG
ncbi:hypothetical protein [Plantactinospora soyae]|uniref:Uncharacterized protein n=1 Tax=Plantactinospora soyae TaxID=1544732 RepID=A0A927QZK4_9ACTN|nr:hypothetical protein [Plantactinospora soyae]MBE1487693.1 hypothetical protein [Plantactinospora soyae]